MRELIAGISAAFVSLFGFGTPAPAPSSSVGQPTSAIVAQAAPMQTAAVVSATHGVLYVPRGIAAAYTADSASPPDDATSTVQYITQPVIERTVQTVVADASGVDEKISALRNELIARMNTWAPAVSFSGPPAFTPVSVAAFAASQKIDQLANVTISNVTVDGVTGLTDADVPDTITASNYLPLSGGTVTGALVGSSFDAASVSGGYFIDGTSILTASTTLENLSIGQNALATTSVGSKNTAVGSQTLRSNTSGSQNTAMGRLASYSNSTGNLNVSMGEISLYRNTTGSSNTALGAHALYGNTSATGSVAVGLAAAAGSYSSYSNQGGTYVGYKAGYMAKSGSDFNILVGYQAGHNVTTGSNNIWIGTATSSIGIANLTTGSQNILIGNNISLPSATASGQLNIGNILYGTDITGTGSTLSSGKIGIGTSSPGASLHIAANDSGDELVIGDDIWSLDDAGNRLMIGNTDQSSFFRFGQSSSNFGILGWQYNATASNSYVSLMANGGSNPLVLQRDGGNVGIATTSPWRTLSVTGTVGFDGLTGSTGVGSLCLSASREVVYNSGSDACLPSLRGTKHDISSLSVDALEMVDALDPVSFVYNNSDGRVRYGFIAEDTAAVDSHLVTYSASGTLSGIDDRSIISIVVKAIQELGGKIAVILDRLNRHDDQIAALEARIAALEVSQGAAAADSGSGNSPAPSGESENVPPDTEPPVITITGNNPATLQVGDTYSDLGAIVTDNIDLNLGYQVFVGSTPLDQADIDTSEPNEWHIHYVATDNAGNTATSTRTVIVESPSIVPTGAEEEAEQEAEPVPTS